MAEPNAEAQGIEEKQGDQDRANRYAQIVEKLFFNHYVEGASEVLFQRSEMEEIAAKLGISLPKNIGDVIYSMRYRMPLPPSIVRKAPAGKQWIILPAGKARYSFRLTDIATIRPRSGMLEIKIPDATPGIIVQNALADEQALLAKVRYNRLIDTFLGVTCYPLQSHLRTTVTDVGQVETDEIYIGIDKKGAQYVVPVQAKRGEDKLSVVQIWQDFAMCAEKFSNLICRPIAAIQVDGDVIALLLFEKIGDDIKIVVEQHYKLVEPSELTESEIRAYNARACMQTQENAGCRPR